VHPGAANAGIPLALIVERYGWNTYFVAMGAACIAVVLLITPMVNLKSYSQRVTEDNAKLA
jgi:sugar phosphate permease